MHDDQHANAPKRPFDLDEVRDRLQRTSGAEYWRSLDELAGTEEFRRLLHDEFPGGVEFLDPVSRRNFVKLMGASLALAGVTACTRQPAERIVPYVRQPEEIVPGKPLFFATAMPMPGHAMPLLVESHEGRPTKIEGNPDHPESLGSTDAFAQASVLGLYDPDRARTITLRGNIESWGAFLTQIKSAVESARGQGGAGLRLLTGSVTSPTLAAQLQQLQADLPNLKWHQWEPAGRGPAYAGARLAFGEYMDAHYHLDQAEVVLALDSDFLASGRGSVRHARQFADRRRVTGGKREMNRLYAVEATPSPTGSIADHRLPLRATLVAAFAQALADALGVPGSAAPADTSAFASWLPPIVRDLQAHRGRSLVVVGDEQPAEVHAIGHAINQALGNAGRTVTFTEPIEARPVDEMASLWELVNDMEAGRVETLVVIDSNPVYTAPADMRFADRMSKVRLRVHAGLYQDETAALCHWQIPMTHYLESWSDARAADGSVTIVQPLVAPLYAGRTPHEVVAAMTKQAGQTPYEIVRAYWQQRAGQTGAGEFEKFWRKALHDGIVPGTVPAAREVTVRSTGLKPRSTESGDRPVTGLKPRSTSPGGTGPGDGAGDGADRAPVQGKGLEIVFRPDPSVFDGRFANNGWLQELPKPNSKLTWDNAALVSPKTAQALGVANEDLVELRYRGRRVTAPAWVVPGQAPDSVAVYLGYGRTGAGGVGNGTGFNAYAIRTSHALWASHGLEIAKTGQRYQLATTQNQQAMEGREIVRAATLQEFRAKPDFARERVEAPPRDMTLYPEHKYTGHAWAMAIDLGTCIGCNACVVACNSENNIPVVGKTEVGRGHKMHWLRVDRYYKGDADRPEAFNAPVPCMHCENAPCEVVCPVAATVHSHEGLNDMVYNRCVGTRYCSNNCPYKVRRFNFFLYQDWTTPSLKMLRNPDVSVRSRGVMEKCTYCVQRINAAKIEAEKENRGVRDGEIVTACQAACPTRAIVFGDLNDPDSQVVKLKAEPLNYGMLEDLNTRPRTTYLAAVRNPNPEMPGGEPENR
jgi:molybdopterin-containing oxidoreductase family iron-sulfur binding subunit